MVSHWRLEMTQFAVLKHNNTLYTYSWTTGVTEVMVPERIMTDDDALAYAMYLTRRGQADEAEEFLDQYCEK